MYLYCFARSERAKAIGNRLLAKSEGEWIIDSESFVVGLREQSDRVDGAVVLILPAEAAVKLLIDRLYPEDVKYPVILLSPDGSYGGVLKSAGYNTHEILNKICSITGAKPISSESDRADFAPDLHKIIEEYDMSVSDPDLLEEICSKINSGLSVNIYSDIPLHMSEPVLDTLSYSPYIFRNNQKGQMENAFVSSCTADEYSIFITCSTLPEVENKGKCLVLIPRIIVVGMEIAGRADPDYSLETVIKTLKNHEIDPRSVCTVAVSTVARENPAIDAIAEHLGCFVTSFDGRLIKAVHVPLNATYSGEKTGADMCTAAACLASDNGRILVRRAGDRNSIILTAMAKKGNLILTK